MLALEGLMKYDPLSSMDGLKGKLIIAIDTETTGLKSHLPHSQILEVAAIVYDLENNKEIETYLRNIKIENLPTLANVLRHEKITKPDYNVKDALKLNQYSKKKNIDNLKESMLGLQEFVDKYPDAIIVMHNAKFDMRFINRYLSSIGAGIHNTVFDSEEFAAKFILPALKKLSKSNPDINTMLQGTLKQRKNKNKETGEIEIKYTPSYGLQELGRAFGVKADSAHTAISDVQQMIKIIQKMFDFVNEHANEIVDYKQDISKWDRRAKKKFSRRLNQK